MVRRAEPWAVAAAPPATMKLTQPRDSVCSRPEKSVTLACRPPPCFAERFGERLQPRELLEALFDGQREVVPDQRPIDVPLIPVDNPIQRASSCDMDTGYDHSTGYSETISPTSLPIARHDVSPGESMPDA